MYNQSFINFLFFQAKKRLEGIQSLKSGSLGKSKCGACFIKFWEVHEKMV